MSIKDLKIAIIGLGYVGLPLAVEFGKKYQTLGFDISQSRVSELKRGKDSTLEVSDAELSEVTNLSYSDNVEELQDANVYIVTVPTPIDEHKQPDLTPLVKASEMLGKVVSKGDIIVYESTVYPGATEDVCIPVVEKVSGLVFNKDFFAGYSPERINPGDKEHRVTNILKVTSGSTPEIAEIVDGLYCSIISAGTHKASTIKVAEAAKVIENTQRDVNIALINELSIIFNKLNIHVNGANILIMGLTFKENCPDLRNTKVVDIVNELKEYNVNVDIMDPWCSADGAKREYDLNLTQEPLEGYYDAIILAVAHDKFKAMGAEKIRALGKEQHIFYDLKYLLPKDDVDMRL